MSSAGAHAKLVGLVLASTVACSLRSLDHLDTGSAEGGSAGRGGTGEGGSLVGGTFSTGGTSVGGTSSTGGVEPKGGSGATGGSDTMGGSDAGGGTPANGGTASGGASGGSAGAGSGSGGASGGAGGMGALGGTSGGGASGSAGGGAGGAGGSTCDTCPLKDEMPYVLRPGHDTTKCADISRYDTRDGAIVQQWACFNQGNQIFWAEDHGSERYALRNAHSGKCIQADGGSLNAGANIRQAPCTGALYQLWRPVAEGGRYRLVAAHSSLVLDVSGSAPTADGAALVQNPADDLLDSSWELQEGSRGAFMLLSVPGQPTIAAARVDEEIRVVTTTGPAAQWKLLPGLANNACVSFESPTEPGHFMRHAGEEIRFEPDDDTAEFAADATFCYRLALAGTEYVFNSLESHNQPGQYVTRSSDVVVLSPFEETAAFRAAATWSIHEP